MTSSDASRRASSPRENDGIHLGCSGTPAQDTVTVSVDDTRDGHHLDLAVARDRALEGLLSPIRHAT